MITLSETQMQTNTSTLTLTLTAALIGNPNVGKTTLFNSLTGSNQYVGNWAGVTIEKKEGYLKENVKIVDLPGIYALDTFSNEEKVAKEFLLREPCDIILNIVDASNLRRNLYLTSELMQFNKPIVLLFNMTDVAYAKGITINYPLMEKELGVKIIPISASKGKGIDEIRKLFEDSNFFSNTIDNRFQLEKEEVVYKRIDSILEKCLTERKTSERSVTDKIDKVLLNKYLAYPAFLFIIFLIFKITFNWVGAPLSSLLNYLVNTKLVSLISFLLKGNSLWFRSLISDGILGGVGAVIVFLPVIMVLFFCISILEDSGYMARTAFIMDKIMRRMGLSGKAFIPLIIGFGCSVPAIMSSRTLESEKDRKLTALIAPLMSCNARIPVYALFASVFFSSYRTTVVYSLYLLGIIMAFVIGILFKNTILKKDEEPFIIELPEYKLPELKNLLRHTWDKGKGFLVKIGTIIFSISIIVWFLSNFNFSGMVSIENSILAQFGRIISPVFKPLGFGSWENSIALIIGLMGKEVIVGTMGVIYGSNGSLSTALPNYFTFLSAYSFLVFVLLYTPCVSVIVTMKKEYGAKFAAFSVAYQFALAWISAFLVFNIGSILLKFF